MLDTHDGVGVMGVKGILTKEEIGFIIQSAKEHGAYISYKTRKYGEEPYEINTTWWSAINGEGNHEDIAFQVKRYIASRSIAFVIKGVPAVYTHGALALLNDYALVEKTGVKRDVNRGLIDPDIFAEQLKDPQSKRSLLRYMFSRIALNRTRNRTFHPQGEQLVLSISPDVFTVLRISPERDLHVLTMTNVTARETKIEIPLNELGVQDTSWRDLISGNAYETKKDKLSVHLEPYDVIWLTLAEQYRELDELAALEK